MHRFCRQSFFQWKPTVFVAYLLCAKNWVRPQGYSNERGGWSFCPHGAEQIYGNETNNCNKQFLETRDPLRLCSSRRSPSCDECMHVACEPLETRAGLWILTLPSAFQPNFLLSCARPFTVQELVRLATGLFLTSSFAHFPLVLSFIDPCTMVSRKHSQGKPSHTLLAPIRLLVAPPGTMPSAALCHCTWPHRSAGICCGSVSL